MSGWCSLAMSAKLYMKLIDCRNWLILHMPHPRSLMLVQS